MLIRADPASRLPCAAPAASSASHSAGHRGRAVQAAERARPGGREWRRDSGGRAEDPAGGTARGRVRTGRDGPPPPARVAVRRGGAALGGAGQRHPTPRAARAARCLPPQPLHDGMASAAAPRAAQEEAERYVKAEYRQCGWGLKCPSTVTYRSVLRPRYKIGYKTVTDLAWRCCPGLSGESCPEHLTDHGTTPPHQEPEPQIPLGQLGPGPRPPPYGREAPSPHGRKSPGLFGERLKQLEGDVQRLSQAYGTLSGLMASHEDPNRITGDPRAPAAPIGFGVIPEGLVDPEDRGRGPLTSPLGEVLSKMTEVSNTLRTKVQLLDEVHGMALSHEAHLQRLRESPPSPLTSLALLEEYVDKRLQRLWGNLLDGFEQKLQGVQSECDLRVQEVRQQCEEGQAASRRLHQSLDGRELALRQELSQLGTQLQGLSLAGGRSCCSQLSLISARVDNLERNLQAVTEAQGGPSTLAADELARLSAAMLQGGVDGLLEGLETTNGTEDGARGCCLRMEMGGWGVAGFGSMLEERVQSLEERLATLAGELSHNSAILSRSAPPLVQTELAVLEQRLISLETACAPSATSAILDNLVAEVKAWQSRSEALLRQVASHTALLQQLNGTVAEVQGQLAEGTGSSLQGEITLLKVNLNSVSKSLTGLSDSVSQYSDAFLAANTSLDERERKVEAEMHAIQEQVSSQGSRLQAGHRQVLNLRGELEQLKAGVASVAGGLNRCRDTAQELQHTVGYFDQRVAQVEGACERLGLLAARLDSLPTDQLGARQGLWGRIDQLNRTLTQHTQDISQLQEALLDCQAQLAKVRPGRAV